MNAVLASGGPHLPGFLAGVAGVLDSYGIWAVGLLLLLENIGVPVIPGETAMIAGAIYAGAGRLNIVEVGVVSLAAAFIGAQIGYVIGHSAGREVVLRYGRYVFVREHHLDRAERAMDRYGGAMVLIARFIVGLRELNGIISGVTGMKRTEFTLFNAIGATAWVATWVTLGYVAGDHIETIYRDISRYALYVLLAMVVVAAAYIARRLIRRRRRLLG